MSLWFSISAAVPSLIESGQISGMHGSLLTGAVQIGFVFGTFVSAFLGLADRFDPRRIFAISAVLGSLANALILMVGLNDASTLLLRFFTGALMAGIYPVGMKMTAGWADRDMGLMMGALVGAVTLGSALPYLFIALGDMDWRKAVSAASASALVGACLILPLSLGPSHGTAGKFRLTQVIAMLKRRSVLLVNGGYLGHMWELYAMWAWIGAFLAWGLQSFGASDANAKSALWTFCVIASGGIGSVLAGAMADLYGRVVITTVAMLISGICALVIGFTPEIAPWLMISIALIWGMSIIADSAQFSAALAELTEPELVGSMLTVQTCLGFLLTFVAIQLMPLMVEWLTWRYAFMFLAIGPFLGVFSMWRLSRQPDASQLKSGGG